ncbi:GDSL-type esterase/lipase family protein [Lentisphaera profundi]|uniref:GDSL-type esterase/lipase family protein n=1 Tax=Lentisphaera profundi TaxID=1658616 RepID=A0ABY7VYJ8_9BACT|nr:GDSL-type esterase/lipase family protein [Lentisphaera profundi]WDE99320.1 GDSL-type esterase/lipase family protein [Lentisphaera profundi]
MIFKKIILAGLLSSILIPTVFCEDQARTVIPVKSSLKKFMPRLHEAKLAEAKNTKVDWVMIGDSITHAWGRDYKGTFAGSKLLNLGFPGDSTQHVLWRIQHGALDGISPKLVTLLIGTNNLRPAKGVHSPDKPEDTFAGIQAIVAEVRTRLPNSKLMVFSIFPRGPQAANERVKEVNAMLPQLNDNEHIFHVNINGTFLDDQDKQIEAYYSKDGVHLIPAGYAAWAKTLQVLLKKEGFKINPNIPASRVKQKSRNK